QVTQEARLIDGSDWANAHGDGGELPVIAHQPGVRIAGQAVVGAGFGTEVAQLVFAEAAFQIGAGVDAWGRMALEIDQVTAVLFAGGVEEVVKADFVERGRRRITGDMAAHAVVLAVGLYHHGHSVPAHDRANAPFQRRITRRAHLGVLGNGVDVGRIRRKWNIRAGTPRA